MVRYVNERWELPLKSFSILKESINEIILFKAISFEMEVNKSASLLNESNNYYKDFIIKNLNICINEIMQKIKEINNKNDYNEKND